MCRIIGIGKYWFKYRYQLNERHWLFGISVEYFIQIPYKSHYKLIMHAEIAIEILLNYYNK